MQILSSHPIGIDRGSVLVFSDFEDDGPMWASGGPRLVRQRVTFSRPFRAPPEVIVTLEMWDLHSDTNARGDLAADEITAEAFDVVFKTWGDSRVARIRAGWLAIGAMAHDDDWDV